MVVKERSSRTFVLDLDTISRDHIKLVGAKAASLGELRRHGFLVPDGYVLTTLAFEYFLKFNRLNIHPASMEKVENARFPEAIIGVVDHRDWALRKISLAVRSSAVEEDQHDSSYAGLYATTLDVRGFDDLISAIKRCWSSTFSMEAKNYEKKRSKLPLRRMAVLVQRLVAPEASGIIFTANPISGDDETIIEAVRGLGDKLASGESTPDKWLVRGQDAAARLVTEHAIDRKQALHLATLAKRVERYFCSPQDIEWSISKGKTYVLQSRPITAIRRVLRTPPDSDTSRSI